ncbi:MAG: hypothetical protein WC523_04405 [Patescibacteria group bacterium]
MIIDERKLSDRIKIDIIDFVDELHKEGVMWTQIFPLASSEDIKVIYKIIERELTIK